MCWILAFSIIVAKDIIYAYRRCARVFFLFYCCLLFDGNSSDGHLHIIICLICLPSKWILTNESVCALTIQPVSQSAVVRSIFLRLFFSPVNRHQLTTVIFDVPLEFASFPFTPSKWRAAQFLTRSCLMWCDGGDFVGASIFHPTGNCHGTLYYALRLTLQNSLFLSLPLFLFEEGFRMTYMHAWN